MSNNKKNNNDNDELWVPFEAQQVMSTDVSNPGFVWLARMHITTMGVPVAVHVCDAWVKGQGHLQATIMKIISLLRSSTTTPKNQNDLCLGEGLRWLAELALVPTVLRSNHMHWEDIDEKKDNRIKLTYTDPYTQQELSVYITIQDGLWTRVECMRPRFNETTGIFERIPWFGVFSKYKLMDQGYLLPSHMECGWREGTKEEYYFKADVKDLVFEQDYHDGLS
jgi:hypothetical protein